MIHDDAGGLLTATIAGTLLTAAGAPDHLMETIPVSAGITGALLAGLKSRQQEPATQRYQWVISVISGVATAIFCGPVLTANVLGFTSVPAVTFAYFVLGLLGSTLVDVVIENRLLISTWLIRRGVSKISDPPIVCPVDPNAPKPPTPATSATKETKLGE
jgi:hypothetical protein